MVNWPDLVLSGLIFIFCANTIVSAENGYRFGVSDASDVVGPSLEFWLMLLPESPDSTERVECQQEEGNKSG